MPRKPGPLTTITPKPTTRDCEWHNSGTYDRPVYANCTTSAIICFNRLVPMFKDGSDKLQIKWLLSIRAKLVKKRPLDTEDLIRLNADYAAWWLKCTDYTWR